MRTTLIALGSAALLVVVILVTWFVSTPDEENESTAAPGDTATASEEPKHELTIALLDGYGLPTPGADIYFSREGKCFNATEFMRRVWPERVGQVSIEVEDDGGEVVAIALAPIKAPNDAEDPETGCVVLVPVEVPFSEVYRVTTSGGSHLGRDPLPDQTQTVKRNDLGQYVEFYY